MTTPLTRDRPNSGEERAAGVIFEEMLEQFGPGVYRFLLQLTRHAPDADDLYQETALKAFRAFGRLDAAANHRAWLYRIAGNSFLSDRRKRARLEPLEDAAAALLPVPAEDVAARIDAGAALARVNAAIATLPPKQRMALIARRRHDLGYAEIASLLGCSEAAARANVHEAVRKLRDACGDLLV